MAINNILFPPKVDTFMPAFVRTEECRVYFALSRFSRLDQVRSIQVTVSSQKTNQSVLDTTKYPTGIKISELQTDNERQSEDRFFITIAPSDLKSGVFELNQFYKVQMRVTGTEAAPLPDPVKIHSWLDANLQHFSEWSTVCLIKGIDAPTIELQGFDDSPNSQGTIFTSQLTEFVGRMSFPSSGRKEKEYLQEYEIYIYKSSEMSVPIFKSGVVYTSQFAPNEINYSLKLFLEDAVSYVVEVRYKTNNGYRGSKQYSFTVIQHGIDKLNADITCEPDMEEGRMKVAVKGKDLEPFLGNITVRRASSKTDFTIWEDVHAVALEDGAPLDYTWYDYTIESGVWYKYAAQKRNSKGDRGVVILTQDPSMIVFQDMFLTRDGLQMKIKLDPFVTSFRRVVRDTIIEGIGSKHPYVNRLGSVDYKQFNINGLISSYVDMNNLFGSEEEFYGESRRLYQEYNEEERTDLYRDYIYEKAFRDKAMNFLYSSKAILFRTATEGNIVIRLTDVNMSPVQALGRLLYSFSATATEIDENDFDSLIKHGLVKIGSYKSQIQYQYNKVSQIVGTFNGASQDVISAIGDMFNKRSSGKTLSSIDSLKWLRLEFQSEPYAIKRTPTGLEPFAPNESSSDALIGYIAYINNSPVFVNSKGQYELKGEDVHITSLWFPKESDVLVDFSCQAKESENTSSQASRLSHFKKIAQLWGRFDYEDMLSKNIYLKHFTNYSTHYERLTAITSMSVESEDGAMLFVKDARDDKVYPHRIGATGVLNFNEKNTPIIDFYFGGMSLYPKMYQDRKECKDNEYVNTNIEITDFAQVHKKVKNGVYTVSKAVLDTIELYMGKGLYIRVGSQLSLAPKHLSALVKETGNKVIWYKGEWFLFNDGLVICPVEGLVDYLVEIVKGEY